MDKPQSPHRRVNAGHQPIAKLSDGTVLLFRPIRPDDRDRIRDGFNRLSPESRYRRFFRPIDRLTDEQLDYLTNVDRKNHVAWVAVLRDEPGQPGVGVARWIRDPSAPDTAEAAVTVIDAFHNRGIGTTLLQLAAASAIERGIRRLRAWAVAGNQPVLDILERLGARAGRWESGILEVTVDLPERAEDLTRTPAPLILRAVASGQLAGALNLAEMGGLRFLSPQIEDGGAPDRT